MTYRNPLYFTSILFLSFAFLTGCGGITGILSGDTAQDTNIESDRMQTITTMLECRWEKGVYAAMWTDVARCIRTPLPNGLVEYDTRQFMHLDFDDMENVSFFFDSPQTSLYHRDPKTEMLISDTPNFVFDYINEIVQRVRQENAGNDPFPAAWEDRLIAPISLNPDAPRRGNPGHTRFTAERIKENGKEYIAGSFQVNDIKETLPVGGTLEGKGFGMAVIDEDEKLLVFSCVVFVGQVTQGNQPPATLFFSQIVTGSGDSEDDPVPCIDHPVVEKHLATFEEIQMSYHSAPESVPNTHAPDWLTSAMLSVQTRYIGTFAAFEQRTNSSFDANSLTFYVQKGFGMYDDYKAAAIKSFEDNRRNAVINSNRFESTAAVWNASLGNVFPSTKVSGAQIREVLGDARGALARGTARAGFMAAETLVSKTYIGKAWKFGKEVGEAAAIARILIFEGGTVGDVAGYFVGDLVDAVGKFMPAGNAEKYWGLIKPVVSKDLTLRVEQLSNRGRAQATADFIERGRISQEENRLARERAAAQQQAQEEAEQAKEPQHPAELVGDWEYDGNNIFVLELLQDGRAIYQSSHIGNFGGTWKVEDGRIHVAFPGLDPASASGTVTDSTITITGSAFLDRGASVPFRRGNSWGKLYPNPF